MNMVELDPRENSRELRPQPADDTEQFQVGKMPGKNVKLGLILETELKMKIQPIILKTQIYLLGLL